VCGIDLRGHGRSGGHPRCFIENFDADYSDDVRAFAASVRGCDLPAFARTPIFLVGGSLGGCIAMRAAIRDASLFAGLVLLAPMLSLEKVARQGLNWLLRPIGAAISLLAPAAAVRARRSRACGCPCARPTPPPAGHNETVSLRRRPPPPPLPDIVVVQPLHYGRLLLTAILSGAR